MGHQKLKLYIFNPAKLTTSDGQGNIKDNEQTTISKIYDENKGQQNKIQSTNELQLFSPSFQNRCTLAFILTLRKIILLQKHNLTTLNNLEEKYD